MNLSFSRKTVLSLLLAAILLIGVLPGAAFAGSNGQQINVNLACSFAEAGALKQVTVEGINQAGNYAVWSGSTRWCNLGTNNWWWVGSATVTVKYTSIWGTRKTTTYTNVPKSQSGNWWSVNVK